MEEIETVEKHCKHEDCVYRSKLTDSRTPFCAYIIYAHQSRGCPISSCTRYVKGKHKRVELNGELVWDEN